MQWRKRSIRKSGPFELRQLGEGMRSRTVALASRRAAAAPFPGVPGAGEADLGHQRRDRPIAKTERGRESLIDRILASRGANMAGVRGEAVGKVDSQPFGPEATVG